VNVLVDGAPIAVAPGTTVLEAIRACGGDVPTLCFDERLAPFGACRVCLVSIDGKPATSCTTPCREGMAVATRDPHAQRIAANVVELVLSELPGPPQPDTELAAVARRLVDGEWRDATTLVLGAGLQIHPADLVRAAVAQHDDDEGEDYEVPAAARAAVEDALAGIDVPVEEYYSLSGRLETIQLICDVIAAALRPAD